MGGGTNYRSQDFFPELAAAKLGTGLVWEKPEFSLEINSFLACLRLSPCLWLTEHSGICSQVLSALHGLPTHAEKGSFPPPVKTTGATTH